MISPSDLLHQPVMLKECLQGFEGSFLKTFFEGTLGSGGHARALLKTHPEIERYIGCDQDPQALQIAKTQLQPWGSKIEFIRGNFRDLDKILGERGITKVNGFFLTWECHLCNLIRAKKVSVLSKRGRST